MAASIKDVAREAGVSIATVSRVLNGIDIVNDDTKRKVLEAIEKLQYRPNILARSLKTQKSSTIGIIIPDISNPIYPEIVRGAEDVASIYNYNIMLSNTDLDKEREKENFNILSEKMVDGIIYMGKSIDGELREIIKRINIPVISIGTIYEKNEIPSVGIDTYEASNETATYLEEKGNNNIAYIGYNQHKYLENRKMFDGYRDALELKGKYKEELVYLGALKAEDGYKGINNILENNKVDAIFCSNDEIAMGAINALREKNIKVPEDVDVIGFDDITMASIYHPKLTTISKPLYDMGSVGMRLLIKIINKLEVDETCYLLPYNIVERESCK